LASPLPVHYRHHAGVWLALALALAGCALRDGGLAVVPGDDPDAAGEDAPGDGPDGPAQRADGPSPLDLNTGTLATGEPCTAGGPGCASGFCVDGVCCENGCARACQACATPKTGALSGRCRPVIAGTDPDNECPEDPSASCKRSGACDGVGACALVAKGTACGAAACSGGTLTPGATCDGAGTCAPGTPKPCVGGYACASGEACKTTCAVDADCATNLGCDPASGSCAVTRKAKGQPCAADGECSSNICADGVCCDKVCTGRCRACLKALTGSDEGTCADIMAGVKPTRQAECPVQLAACGNNGRCDGAGGCQAIADGTQCGTYCCGGVLGGSANFCHLACAAGACTVQTGTAAGSCDDKSPCTRDRCEDQPAAKTHTCARDGACTAPTGCCCTGLALGVPFCADPSGCTVGLGGTCVP
jgi:hypothetical protein